jgi:hypothetical protein
MQKRGTALELLIPLRRETIRVAVVGDRSHRPG